MSRKICYLDSDTNEIVEVEAVLKEGLSKEKIKEEFSNIFTDEDKVFSFENALHLIKNNNDPIEVINKCRLFLNNFDFYNETRQAFPDFMMLYRHSRIQRLSDSPIYERELKSFESNSYIFKGMNYVPKERIGQKIYERRMANFR